MYFEITKKKKETTMSPVVSFFGLDQTRLSAIAAFESRFTFHFAEIDNKFELFRERCIVAHISFVHFNDRASACAVNIDSEHVVDDLFDCALNSFVFESAIRDLDVN